VRMIGAAIEVIQAYDLAAHQGADAASWIETIEDDLATPVNAHVSAEAPLAIAMAPDDSCRGEADIAMSEADSVVEEAQARPVVDEAPAPAGAALRMMFHEGGEIGRQVFRRGPVFIESVEPFDARNQLTTRLTLLQPFTLKVHYRVEGLLPKPTLGIALAVNSKFDLAPVAQFMTQNIRPFETRQSYDKAADRFQAVPRGTLTLAFEYVPFRKGEYILSLGLLPNEPATWEFYEYRHLYYPFSVDDAGMDVGAPVLLNPVLTHIAKVGETP